VSDYFSRLHRDRPTQETHFVVWTYLCHYFIARIQVRSLACLVQMAGIFDKSTVRPDVLPATSLPLAEEVAVIRAAHGWLS
jgi:hypothetical protein